MSCSTTNHKCSKCNYIAAHNSDLKKHNKYIHEKTEPRCNQCEVSANLKSDLKKHTKTFHENTKFYRSNQCYATTKKANLNHHTKRIHIKQTYDRETLISLRYSGHGVPRCTEDLVRRMGIFALAKRETRYQYIAGREQQLNNHVQTIHKIIRPYNSERQTPKLKKNGSCTNLELLH